MNRLVHRVRRHERFSERVLVRVLDGEVFEDERLDARLPIPFFVAWANHLEPRIHGDRFRRRTRRFLLPEHDDDDRDDEDEQTDRENDVSRIHPYVIDYVFHAHKIILPKLKTLKTDPMNPDVEPTT